MAAPSSNPYAPPDPSYAPGAFVAPLPAGVRRFTLDPVKLRALVVRRVVVTYGVIGLGAVGASVAMNGVVGLFAGVGIAVAVVVSLLLGQRRSVKLQQATYELLLGPHAMRRTLGGFLPAEILRDEVTGIYETHLGLWIMCAAAARSLFVVKAVEGFAEVRAELATWHPIEAHGGLQAWRTGRLGAKRQGARTDAAAGAAPIDAAVAAELVGLRAASSTAWQAYPTRASVPRGKLVLVLWGLLIVVFFVIWEVLQPAPRPRQGRRLPARPAPTAPAEE